MLKVIQILVLGLTGCAHAKVRVYGRYLSPVQTDQLRSSLKTEGFEVTVNNLAFPAEMRQNTLITGLLMERPD